jgi:hypothetical protein
MVALHGWVWIVLLCPAVSAHSATWTVEKDGSGDFSVIQDAIDVASSGDVIQIGPGRFDEVHSFELAGGLRDAHCRAEQETLTIIGSGEDLTIIGPATGPAVESDPIGIMAGPSTSLYVSGLRIENAGAGVQANGPYVSLQNCTFRGCDLGLDALCWVGTLVHGCTFLESQSAGIVVFKPLGAKNVVIENCLFSGGVGGLDLQSQNNLVKNCRFENSFAGMQFSFGATGTIQGCTFDGIQNNALILTGGSQGHVIECQLETSGSNLFISNGSMLTGWGNVLSGGTVYTMFVVPSATVDFHNNHIFNAGGISVFMTGSSNPPKTFDLRNNYWGTPDASQIAEWIHDDTDGQTGSVVLYEPFHGMPVPTKTTSIGELKAMYGGMGPDN